MRRLDPAAVLWGGLGGASAALVVVWLLVPGADNGGVEPSALSALEGRVGGLETTVVPRLAAVEDGLERLSAGGAAPLAGDALARVAGDLRMLRDALRFELSAVNDELTRLSEGVAELSGVSGTGTAGGALTPEEEPRWVVLSGDPDPGVRFSALSRLGRRRSDRSAQASRERLEDTEPLVVWQALRNLASFRERASALDVARRLDHPDAVIRAAAVAALVRMGAPGDSGFDAIAPASERAAGAARLRNWAETAE